MRPMIKIAGLGVAATGLFAAVACTDTAPPPTDSVKSESAVRDAGQDYMVENQPAKQPEYSSDRDNINFWVETWGMGPGQLAYTYLINSEGGFIGYYVFDGLPTSKCKMMTPPYKFERHDGGEYDADFLVPAPGLSATYSTGSGECNTYYAEDPTTGAYVEFAIGNAMTMLTFSEPYDLPEGVNPPALGFTTIDEAENLELEDE